MSASAFVGFYELFDGVYEEVAETTPEPWADVIAESIAASLGIPYKRRGTTVDLRDRKRNWSTVLSVRREDSPERMPCAHHVVWR